ncbi:MAG TPA: hypothetical protein VFB62_12890, partial [Polyangiaceae bacterium]|nr:hypothetical protein [Polyangiaceae bacterium]
ALASLDAPTSVAADRCLLARSQPHPNDLDAGYGAYVGGGATLSIASSNLLDNHTVALAVSDAGTSATVTGSVIARTQPRPRDQRGGIGALVTLGANLSLESTALRENHGMGVASGLDGAIVRARTSVIAGTLPEPDGAEGIGVLATLGALELESCLVRDSRVAAVLVGQAPANATITRSFLYGVSEGTFHTYDGIERIVDTFGGVGDGIVTTFQANVTVTDTLVRDASRVALLFHESGGSIRGVDAAAEHYGLVLQGGSLPDWDHPSNRFSGGDQAVVQQGSLPVPAPPPLPSD